MNRLSIEKRTSILQMFVDGDTLRSAARKANVSHNTAIRLLREAGAACLAYQDEHLRNLQCLSIACNEIWSFSGVKERKVPDDKRALLGEGDVYTWTALDTGTNLVACWHVAVRDAASANAFLCDVAGRMASHSLLVIDERSVYLRAVELRAAKPWDGALLSELYGRDAATDVLGCGPSAQAGTNCRDVFSAPDSEYVATGLVANPCTTMRTCIGPYATVTGAFIRKLESHIHAISLHFMVHNFCKINQPLRITPAMGAGVADHMWSLEEIVMLASELPEPC